MTLRSDHKGQTQINMNSIESVPISHKGPYPYTTHIEQNVKDGGRKRVRGNGHGASKDKITKEQFNTGSFQDDKDL